MAMILDAFISGFSRALLTMVQDEVGALLGVPGELERLSRIITDVRCVLSDAERKQSESKAIDNWISELKDLMYDADDTLELCQIKVHERGDSLASCCCFKSFVMNPAFACKIGKKIKELNLRMDGIVKRISLLGLVEHNRVGTLDFPPIVSFISRKSDPVIVQSDIVGEKIEENCEHLVDLLTKEDTNVNDNMVVIAIVGVGGIGKTTLAKRVFNDQRIKDEFDFKIWVCVSKEVIERDLLKNVIREVGGHYGVSEEKSELLPMLEKLISRKKFLLILDDVWRESEHSWHGLLRGALMSGAHGSRILVTTRDQTVAMRMKAVHSLHVDKLPDEDAWSLLAKQVVMGGEGREIEHLKDIGFEILKNCNGLPLAIKVLGGLLCTKNKTEGDWQAVLSISSTLWSSASNCMLPNDIHVALYLSYEDLPPQLKQCFIFCSLYPEDWEFNGEDLVSVWRAQGFLQADTASSVWGLGIEYYNELVLRNLLEPNHNFYDQAICKMHDLLRLFARYLARNESFSITEAPNLSSRSSPIKLRHLAIKEKDVVVNVLKKQESLRTLLMIEHSTLNLGDVFESLSCLRVLGISYSKIKNLPDSLCCLVHLRYIDAGGSLLETIPEAIGNLKYLEFLNLGGCTRLTHVPISIVDLLELRFLNIYNTKLNGLPAGLKRLKNLVQLHGFNGDGDNKDEFSSFEELEPLSELSTLVLDNFDKVSNRNVADKANLHNKLHLKRMTITYKVQNQNLDEEAIEDVLNAINPPPCLEYLMIDGYFGRHLPHWLNAGTCHHSLRYLMLANCGYFQFIALGHLSNLDFLRIKGAHSVVSVGNEFQTGVFPRLRRLIFEDMSNWRAWHWEKEEKAMPKLKELVIRGCPLLSLLPSGLSHQAISLEYLEVTDVNKLMVIENLHSLKKLVIYENDNLKRVSNLPKLRTIWIGNCLMLHKLDNITNLTSMKVNAWGGSLPEYLREIITEKLTVWCNSMLLEKIIDQGENGFEWQKFKHISQVNLYTKEKGLVVLYRKTIATK